MVSDTRLDESEPISPELVLVAPPDVARVARDQLPDPAPTDAAEPSVATRVAPFTRNGASETVPVPDRLPEPPRYPRVAIEEPPPSPPRRRRGRVVAYAAGVIVAGGAAYLLAVPHHARRTGQAAGVVTPSPTATTPTATTPIAPVTTATHTTVTTAHAKPAAKSKAKPTPTHAARPARAKKHRAASPAASFVPARTWTWPKSNGARGYEMRFVLSGNVVLRLRTTAPRVVLPSSFRFRAGTYRWVVRRIPPAAGGRPIVDSKFVLTAAAAAHANP